MMKIESPDQVVLKADLKARDLLLLAVKGNLNILSAAVSTPEGGTFQLTTHVETVWSREQVLSTLREAGYDIKFPGDNATDEGGKP